MAKRLQRKRTKGFRLPESVVCVTRPGKWGNPFKTSDEFESWMHQMLVDHEFRIPDGHITTVPQQLHMIRIADNIRELRGKDLACWCSLEKACHADSLLNWANIQNV